MSLGRIETPDDPRDLRGEFAHRVSIDVRFADTDAMGHVNNAVYLTYCEMARIRYWSDVTGEPLAARHHGAESLILAEARITYRAQVFHTDVVTVESRATRIGRSSFVLEHRLTACEAGGHPRLVAISESVTRPVRLHGRPRGRARRQIRRGDGGVRGPRPSLTASGRNRQSTTRRKIVTAFWPPKPKPSTATVSILASRAVSGT